jgi:spermidine synthase
LKKTELLAEAKAPDGTVLRLYRHDSAYTIRVNNIELMSTRRHHSEDRLAELVCEPLRNLTGARVLIGGLGLGFTLQSALRSLSPDASVVVCELVKEVVEWNRNTDYPLAHHALTDVRVELRQSDVAHVLRQPGAGFDGIMMDVDNGAESFTTRGNGALYQGAGIMMAVGALRPNGRVAYWSANEDSRLLHFMREAGLQVETHTVRAQTTSGAWHTIYVGQMKAR